MTRTIRRLRAIVGSIAGAIGAAIGTFLVLAWIAVNGLRASEHLLGLSPVEAGVPEPWLWVAVLAVAAGCTIWLERGGYRRLRADPAGGGTVAILSLLCLPLSFLPAAYAVSLLVEVPPVFGSLYLLGWVVVGGWLALYDGLEHLGLELAQFVRAFGLAFWPTVAVAVVDSLLSVGDWYAALVGTLVADVTIVAVAFGWQGVVLAVAFGYPRSAADGPVHSLEE